jgi:hypothetical protein
LATRSSVACPTVPVPSASLPIALSATCGESTGLHYDHCGRDGHVEAFCYKKKKAQKAQAHRSSQGTGGTGFGGSERSSTGSEIQEILMLLRRLVASTLLGVVGSLTQPSVLTGSAIASQSFALGPPSTPSLGTDPWYLVSVHTADGSPLSVAGQGTLCSNSFDVPDVSLVPDLTMQLMFTG